MRPSPKQMDKVRVGRIGYMNVAPVYYGMDHGMLPDWIEITNHPPATLNRMLAAGELDISPISSAAYARHQEDWELLPNLSVACDGEVMSVILASRQPFRDLAGNTIWLTEESETAAGLLKLLFALNKIDVRFRTGRVRHPDDLAPDAAAGLVIGDAALKHDWQEAFPHVPDLAAMWKQLTGLPFVFGLWAVRKSYAKAHPETVARVVDLFAASIKHGRNHMDRIAAATSARLGISMNQSRTYFSKLHYGLGKGEIKGLTTFFNGLFHHGYLPANVRLSYFDPGRHLPRRHLAA